jgi:hypothetical protein
MFHLKQNHNYCTWIPSCTKLWNQLQPYPIVAADAVFEIGTATISSVMSLSEHLSQTNTFCVQKCCYHLVYWYLIRRLVVSKCFLNASWTEADGFDCEVTFENEHTFRSWILEVCGTPCIYANAMLSASSTFLQETTNASSLMITAVALL